MNILKTLFKYLTGQQFTLYMDGGGGGGGQTSGGTTVAELPEWARPYAKDTLSKASALTDTNQNPYQQYNQPRIAGFSPLQQQSQEAAGNMQTNQLTGMGGGIAGAAGMGGLGYAMQQNPQNFQQNVGGYMNPYLQMSLAPQLAEANRNYDIGATKQQSAATQAGAFGGSREAIMAAENERNRNMGLQNIVGQGYNTAFQNAQNQYNQSQQAQLQGLNTALQGANTLGSLGQNQFQQGMDINKLQNAYGGQQQALRQQGLDQAYQDFQNQQNYPYKQLGFMSDMIHGLPLGQQTTQQMYSPPGSVLGQLGGLGLGMYGLSKFMAGGGLAYAGGGDISEKMNDPAFLADEVHKLTDEQLQSIMQHPSSQSEYVAAQQEMAMRASEKGGMAGAFNQLPQDQQQGVVQAAGGGILAFADEGLVTDPMGNVATGGDAGSSDDRTMLEKLGIFNPENRRALEAAEKPAPAKQSTKLPDTGAGAGRGSYTGFNAQDNYNSISKQADKNKVSPEVFSGITQLSKETGTPANSLMDEFNKMRDMLRGDSKSDMEALNKMVAQSAGRSDEIKKQGLGKALAEFGFQWAAQASKPGARTLGSAAAASPSLAASAAKTEELAQAAQDNHQKLAMSMKQFELAQRKGDNATALGWATQVRQLQQMDKQIAMQREHYAAQAGLGQAALAQKADQFNKTVSLHGLTAAAQLQQAKARMMDVQRRANADFETNVGGPRLYNELLKQADGNRQKADYMYNQKKQNYVGGALQDSRDARSDNPAAGGAKSVFSLLSSDD